MNLTSNLGAVKVCETDSYHAEYYCFRPTVPSSVEYRSSVAVKHRVYQSPEILSAILAALAEDPAYVTRGDIAAVATTVGSTLVANLPLLICMDSLEHTLDEGLFLQALSVVLKHPVLAANQRCICKLLQISKACRTAVQQSAASLTKIKFEAIWWSPTAVLNSTNRFHNMTTFADWISTNPQLVNSVSVCPVDWHELAGLPAVQELLEHCLQTAATKPDARFCLASYESCIPATARLLVALPAATLTKLEIEELDSSDCFTALGQLTKLRHLRLGIDGAAGPHATEDDPMQTICRLQKLVHLDLCRVPIGCDLRLLPAQLQQLTVHYTKAWQASVGAVACLQHLRSLQHLQLSISGELAAGSSVPPNLSSLHIMASWPAGAVAGLSNLHQVTSVQLVHSSGISSQDLRSFKRLPHLVDLSLIWQLGMQLRIANCDVLAVAAVWQDLPLRNLCVLIRSEGISSGEFAGLMQHIGAATNLTFLQVDTPRSLLPDPMQTEPVVFEQLKALKNLRELNLNMMDPGFTEQEAQRGLQILTSLSSLTCLEDFRNAGHEALQAFWDSIKAQRS